MSLTFCGPNCTTEQKNSHKGCGDPEISYVGRVLYKYEKNGYDDSDFVAIVWDDETNDFKHIEYGSTRSWTYHNHATVDADAATLLKAEARLADLLFKRAVESHNAHARTPDKGKTVKSLMTRGTKKDVTGEVRWYGEDRYKSSRWLTVYSVGIKVEGNDKLVYLAADKVEVLNPEAADEAYLRELSIERAKQHAWRLY